MTVQISDTVKWNGTEYMLLGREEGTTLVTSGNFKKPQPESLCTACGRGWLAKYYIEDNRLYGKVKGYGGTFSARHVMRYTGTILIAYLGDEFFVWNSAPFFCFFEKAFELRFEEGRLVEWWDLAPALKEWREYNTMQSDEDKYNFIESHITQDAREALCEKYLHCKYSKDGLLDDLPWNE